MQNERPSLCSHERSGMKTHVEHADIPQPLWDPEEERALEERLVAAGMRLPTKSLDRARVAVRGRPPWLAFLVRLYRRAGG